MRRTEHSRCGGLDGTDSSTAGDALRGRASAAAQDLVYYTRMFAEDMQRDPTNVELFDIAQSNSEHRRGRGAARQGAAVWQSHPSSHFPGPVLSPQECAARPG